MFEILLSSMCGGPKIYYRAKRSHMCIEKQVQLRWTKPSRVNKLAK